MSEYKSAEVRQYEAEQAAQALVDQITRFVNVMGADVERDAFATCLANTHPTLLGQIAKAVGIGVMRRAVRDPEWRPFDKYEQTCSNGFPSPYGENVRHSGHDGRLDCNTIIGAELLARQSFI